MIRKKRSLGYGFADEVAKVTFRNGHFKKGETPNWVDGLLPNFNNLGERDFSKNNSWRVALFLTICIVVFFAVFVRLFHLQIVKGKTNRELADGNRIQIKIIHAPRGVIFDRNGKILASNSPAFRLFDPENKKIRFITREQALELEVKNDSRAETLEVDNVRTYPVAEKLAHVLGYVGEVSQEQLKLPEYKNYRPGDRVGKSGVEAQYEKLLRGLDGGEIIEVDSKGKKLRTLRINPPIAGQNVYLNIDLGLQEKIYQLLVETTSKTQSCCAAAIAADPSNGQVLALVSYPSFDPNIFSKSEDLQISSVFTDPNSPILNRVVGGTYPPGSTYKIISSLAALSSGKITADTTIQDNGIIRLGPFSFTNWYFTQYGRTEGPVNLIKALQRSNDIYYYEIGRIIGEQALAEWSQKLFLGKKLGIDLPGEEDGLVADDAWKQKTFGQPWYPGDTLHMAIGQGFLLTTPLQVLGMASYVAGDGNLYEPQLVQKIVTENSLTSIFKPKVLVSNLTSSEHLNYVKKGLEAVPKDGGTAWPFFAFPIPTAGKTGTAEFGHPKNQTHAWYTGYAPIDDPKIVMAVLIEAGGEGSSVASPVVKESFRWFFSEDKSNLLKDLRPVASESARTLGE